MFRQEAPRRPGDSVLQGTFETLSLPEVLGLLASARKSGALLLEAGPVSSVVHVKDGHCRAVETADQRTPVATGQELLGRLVDVCFAITRQDGGAFRFADDEPPPWSIDEPVELSDALVEVDRLLKQWREILRVIPSLDYRPRLLEALDAEEILLDREHWSILAMIDGRRSVRDLVQRAARPVMDVCHALLELVEAGALGISDPATTAPVEAPPVVTEPAPAPAPPVVTEPAPAPAPPAPAPPPVVAEPVPAPEVTAEESRDEEEPPVRREPPVRQEPPAPEEQRPADDGGEAPDRGAFLRLFSGLRE